MAVEQRASCHGDRPAYFQACIRGSRRMFCQLGREIMKRLPLLFIPWRGVRVIPFVRPILLIPWCSHGYRDAHMESDLELMETGLCGGLSVRGRASSVTFCGG